MKNLLTTKKIVLLTFFLIIIGLLIVIFKNTPEAKAPTTTNTEQILSEQFVNPNETNMSSTTTSTTTSTPNINPDSKKDNPKPTNTLPKSTWLWHYPTTLSDLQMQEYINLLNAENFNTVYIDITGYIDAYESPDPNAKKVFEDRLTKFVDLADASNIKVEGLVGGNMWAQPKYDYVPGTILDFVIKFNQKSNHAKLQGVQYDVESYNLPEFSNQEQQAVILGEYLTMVQTLTNKVRLQSPNLRLGFAVPFWFDNYTRDLPLITFKDQAKPVGFHVLDILQAIDNGYIAIMDYRNKTEGQNGSIKLAEPQINYATKNTPHVGVIIAQETTNVEPLSITFYNQPKTNLNNALNELAQAFSYTKSLEGFAIHDLDGYRELIKN
jgi:hypothetical protein